MKSLYAEVGESPEGRDWADNYRNRQGKSSSELLAKTAMVSLIGSWGRVQNSVWKMAVCSVSEDVPWNGPVHSKPGPCSEVYDGTMSFTTCPGSSQSWTGRACCA